MICSLDESDVWMNKIDALLELNCLIWTLRLCLLETKYFARKLYFKTAI